MYAHQTLLFDYAKRINDLGKLFVSYSYSLLTHNAIYNLACFPARSITMDLIGPLESCMVDRTENNSNANR